MSVVKSVVNDVKSVGATAAKARTIFMTCRTLLKYLDFPVLTPIYGIKMEMASFSQISAVVGVNLVAFTRDVSL